MFLKFSALPKRVSVQKEISDIIGYTSYPISQSFSNSGITCEKVQKEPHIAKPIRILLKVRTPFGNNGSNSVINNISRTDRSHLSGK